MRTGVVAVRPGDAADPAGAAPRAAASRSALRSAALRLAKVASRRLTRARASSKISAFMAVLLLGASRGTSRPLGDHPLRRLPAVVRRVLVPRPADTNEQVARGVLVEQGERRRLGLPDQQQLGLGQQAQHGLVHRPSSPGVSDNRSCARHPVIFVRGPLADRGQSTCNAGSAGSSADRVNRTTSPARLGEHTYGPALQRRSGSGGASLTSRHGRSVRARTVRASPGRKRPRGRPGARPRSRHRPAGRRAARARRRGRSRTTSSARSRRSHDWSRAGGPRPGPRRPEG